MYMPIVITNVKVRVVRQDSVPCVMKVILTHIPTECGVGDPNVYCIIPIISYTSPHTPLISITPLLPCFSGAIFGKYPYLFI